jgi:hypothetical protein
MSAWVTLTIVSKKNGGQVPCIPVMEDSSTAKDRHLAVLKILGTAIVGFEESAKETACAGAQGLGPVRKDALLDHSKGMRAERCKTSKKKTILGEA